MVIVVWVTSSNHIKSGEIIITETQKDKLRFLTIKTIWLINSQKVIKPIIYLDKHNNYIYHAYKVTLVNILISYFNFKNCFGWTYILSSKI